MSSIFYYDKKLSVETVLQQDGEHRRTGRTSSDVGSKKPVAASA